MVMKVLMNTISVIVGVSFFAQMDKVAFLVCNHRVAAHGDA